MSDIEKYLERELKDFKNGNLSPFLSEDFYSNTTRFIDYLNKIKHGFSISSAMAETFYGPNITANPVMLKPNTNSSGYIFTTRPDLNLSEANLRVERKMMPLLTDKKNHVMHAIRMILCPRLAMRMSEIEYNGTLTGQNNMPRDPIHNLVNPKYPFIAVSDNNVKSMTGWPSGSGLGIHSTPAGILKEVHIQADAPDTFNGEFSLNLSLNSMKGSPNLYLYHYWRLYIGFVLSQTYGMMPWPEYLGNGRLDYTCRHYRLIMDETKTFVEEIAATGYSIPRSIDIGPIFDYQSENPRPYVDKSIEVEFACSGAIYIDELLIKQFNETVCLFNRDMLDGKRQQYLIKVDKKYQTIFNNYCYPRINPITRELEWWVEKDLIKQKKDLLIYKKVTSEFF